MNAQHLGATFARGIAHNVADWVCNVAHGPCLPCELDTIIAYCIVCDPTAHDMSPPLLASRFRRQEFWHGSSWSSGKVHLRRPGLDVAGGTSLGGLALWPIEPPVQIFLIRIVFSAQSTTIILRHVRSYSRKTTHVSIKSEQAPKKVQVILMPPKPVIPWSHALL